MLDHFLRDRAAAQRLRANPIGSHLDGFTAWLSQRGYRVDDDPTTRVGPGRVWAVAPPTWAVGQEPAST